MKYCWESRAENGQIGKDAHVNYLIIGYGAKKQTSNYSERYSKKAKPTLSRNLCFQSLQR